MGDEVQSNLSTSDSKFFEVYKVLICKKSEKCLDEKIMYIPEVAQCSVGRE